MILEQIPVDSSPYQEQTFVFDRLTLRLTMHYNTIGDHWAISLYDMTNERYVCQGMALMVGVPILWRAAVPYFLWLTDESGVGLDPSGGEDMGLRCKLYIGLKAEYILEAGL